MYASLTLFNRRFTFLRSLLLTAAAVVIGLMLVSCGAEESDRGEVAQVAETAMAKKIVPGIAMEQYPPVNTRTDYELKNTQEWLNGEPTTIAEIRDSGRVVVVDFWTYT